MLTFIAFSFLLKLSVVKSDATFETMCKNDYRHLNGTQIDVSKFCSANTCIEKCCGEGEMFAPRGHCTNTKGLFQMLKKHAKLISDVTEGSAKNKSENDFVFIKNQRNLVNCTLAFTSSDFFILEDGGVRMQGSNSWFVIKSLKYCLDFKLTKSKTGTAVVKLGVREYKAAPADEDKKSWFVLVGLLISSFFLLLVLVVYFLLPTLQNLIGLVLMAYTSSTLVTFLVKIVLLFNESLTTKLCKIISPMMYFAAMSSFFWLNVMSYDVWWSLRGHRKRSDTNRRGERVKFMWYCLYAWGSPLLMTAIVTTLDNIDLSNLHITKPPFDNCFVTEERVRFYLIIPIGAIIFVNIIFFSLTVYNIWIIKSAINKCQDSRSNTQDTNRFTTYIKLSVLMGVSWCLELIPPDTPLWVYILTNTYNLLIGVAIFFLFVFKKEIYLKLCQRFNIKNDFTKSFELSSQGTKSRTTRTTRLSMD